MPLEGGDARRVTRTEQRESHPRFLPGGDLLYSTERGGRSRGSRVMRLAGAAGEGATVVETDEPIGGLAASREGQRIAYVVGRLTDARRGRTQFNLFVLPLATGATPVPVTLRPDEQVLSPAF